MPAFLFRREDAITQRWQQPPPRQRQRQSSLPGSHKHPFYYNSKVSEQGPPITTSSFNSKSLRNTPLAQPMPPSLPLSAIPPPTPQCLPGYGASQQRAPAAA